MITSNIQTLILGYNYDAAVRLLDRFSVLYIIDIVECVKFQFWLAHVIENINSYITDTLCYV